MELTVSAYPDYDFFTRTEIKQYVKGLRIIDPINYGNSSDAT
jgi:hypothetical protein